MVALLVLASLAAAEPTFDLPRMGLADAEQTASADTVPAARPVAVTEPACLELPPIGCLYVPAALRPRKKADETGQTLAVYFRGHYGDYRGHVPAPLRFKAARAAFADRGLAAAADAAGVVLLVTGSSDQAVAAADIGRAQSLSGVLLGRLVLAAHSGGYAGLGATLAADSFPRQRIRRVVMLDDFYTDGLLAPLRRLKDRGAFDCEGFYTWQSDDYAGRALSYAGVCRIEKRVELGDDSHNLVVNACFGDYLAGRDCR